MTKNRLRLSRSQKKMFFLFQTDTFEPDRMDGVISLQEVQSILQNLSIAKQQTLEEIIEPKSVNLMAPALLFAIATFILGLIESNANKIRFCVLTLALSAYFFVRIYAQDYYYAKELKMMEKIKYDAIYEANQQIQNRNIFWTVNDTFRCVSLEL